MSRLLYRTTMDPLDGHIPFQPPDRATSWPPYEVPNSVGSVFDPGAGQLRVELRYIDGDEKTHVEKIDNNLSMRLGKYTDRLHSIDIDMGRAESTADARVATVREVVSRALGALRESERLQAQSNYILAGLAIQQYFDAQKNASQVSH